MERWGKWRVPRFAITSIKNNNNNIRKGRGSEGGCGRLILSLPILLLLVFKIITMILPIKFQKLLIKMLNQSKTLLLFENREHLNHI